MDILKIRSLVFSRFSFENHQIFFEDDQINIIQTRTFDYRAKLTWPMNSRTMVWYYKIKGEHFNTLDYMSKKEIYQTMKRIDPDFFKKASESKLADQLEEYVLMDEFENFGFF